MSLNYLMYEEYLWSGRLMVCGGLLEEV